MENSGEENTLKERSQSCTKFEQKNLLKVKIRIPNPLLPSKNGNILSYPASTTNGAMPSPETSNLKLILKPKEHSKPNLTSSGPPFKFSLSSTDSKVSGNISLSGSESQEISSSSIYTLFSEPTLSESVEPKVKNEILPAASLGKTNENFFDSESKYDPFHAPKSIEKSANTQVHCLCGSSREDGFMICCDLCRVWYHETCVGINTEQAERIRNYHCPKCEISHGKSIMKSPPIDRSLRKRKSLNYSDLENGRDFPELKVAVHFMQTIREKISKISSQSIVCFMQGDKFNVEFLEREGFCYPILVEKMDGLGMRMPRNLTVDDVKNLVGGTRVLDVIEVATQAEVVLPWTLSDWADYFARRVPRDKIYNVISLEVSNTKLSEKFLSPQIVRSIDWIDHFWPPRESDECSWPKVQRYCLMSVQGAYTDFHIDFGGSSVWYHVLEGMKLFLFVPPSEENLEKYRQWSSSAEQSDIFFGDLVDCVYMEVVRQGNTLFIPTGWIHAVYTPMDSLVLGGNFLHSYNITLQLRVNEIENQTEVDSKFRFPLYEQMMWYAAFKFTARLKDTARRRRSLNRWEYTGVLSLIETLDRWLPSNMASHIIPSQIPDPWALLKELSELVLRESPEDAILNAEPWNALLERNSGSTTRASVGELLDLVEEEVITKQTLSSDATMKVKERQRTQGERSLESLNVSSTSSVSAAGAFDSLSARVVSPKLSSRSSNSIDPDWTMSSWKGKEAETSNDHKQKQKKPKLHSISSFSSSLPSLSSFSLSSTSLNSSSTSSILLLQSCKQGTKKPMSVKERLAKKLKFKFH